MWNQKIAQGRRWRQAHTPWMASTVAADKDAAEYAEIIDDADTVRTKVLQLAALMRQHSGRVVFVTGAGISTGAGIPDFRSGLGSTTGMPAGKWTQKATAAQWTESERSEMAQRTARCVPAISTIANNFPPVHCALIGRRYDLLTSVSSCLSGGERAPRCLGAGRRTRSGQCQPLATWRWWRCTAPGWCMGSSHRTVTACIDAVASTLPASPSYTATATWSEYDPRPSLQRNRRHSPGCRRVS